MHASQNNAPSADQREIAGASSCSLDGVCGPVRGDDLVNHPAFSRVLTPNPLDSRSVEVNALIDASVEKLTTQSPHFVVPGVSVANRLGDGEKSVIHLPGLREKDVLTWEEIAPFRAHDAEELSQVAARIEERLGVPCDASGALKVIVERMKTLLRESVMASAEEEAATSLKFEIAERKSWPLRGVIQLVPGVRKKDEQLQAELERREQRVQEHAELHEGRYIRDHMRATVSLMQGRLDSLWLFRPVAAMDSSASAAPAEPDKFQSQRINAASIALASLGIFQKGSRHWTQDYPTSPLQFWSEHIEPHLAVGS